jgi:hypothetical protein
MQSSATNMIRTLVAGRIEAILVTMVTKLSLRLETPHENDVQHA